MLTAEQIRRIAQATLGSSSDIEARLQALDFEVEDTGGGCTAWVWYETETETEIIVASDVSHVISHEDFGEGLVSVVLYRHEDIVDEAQPASVDEMFSVIDSYIVKAGGWSQAYA